MECGDDNGAIFFNGVAHDEGKATNKRLANRLVRRGEQHRVVSHSGEDFLNAVKEFAAKPRPLLLVVKSRRGQIAFRFGINDEPIGH